MRPITGLLSVTAALVASAPVIIAADGGGGAVDVFSFAYRDAATGTGVTVIHVGESVTWTWTQFCHSVTQGIGEPNGMPLLLEPLFDSDIRCTSFDPVTHQPLTTFTHAFDAAGAYPYFCVPHHAQMQGVVVVLP